MWSISHKILSIHTNVPCSSESLIWVVQSKFEKYASIAYFWHMQTDDISSVNVPVVTKIWTQFSLLRAPLNSLRLFRGVTGTRPLCCIMLIISPCDFTAHSANSPMTWTKNESQDVWSCYAQPIHHHGYICILVIFYLISHVMSRVFFRRKLSIYCWTVAV